jgi:hypothetical protein
MVVGYCEILTKILPQNERKPSESNFRRAGSKAKFPKSAFE